MAFTFLDEVKGIKKNWKQLQKLLIAPKQASLRPGLSAAQTKPLYQKPPRIWFQAYDGQKPGAEPLHDGWRLVSMNEALTVRRTRRGASYRGDWDDSWVVIARRGKAELLCYSEDNMKLFAVAVGGAKYTKKKVGVGLTRWLQAAIEAHTQEGRTEAKPEASVTKKLAHAKSKEKVALAKDATLAASWKALEVWVSESDEDIKLGRPASAAAIERAAKKFGGRLPKDVRALLARHNGQPERSDALFGNWRLLPAAEAAKEYALNLKIAVKLDDPKFYKPAWWPLTTDGAGNFEVAEAKTGSVILVSNDPYTRRKTAASVRLWLAAHARRLLRDG